MSCARSIRSRARPRRISHRRNSTPPTYYQQMVRRADPARTQRGSTPGGESQQMWEENFRSYGIRKIWRQHPREKARR